MPKIKETLTPFVQEKINDVLDSIIYPSCRGNRYYVTLTFPCSPTIAMAAIIFEAFCRRLKRKFKGIGAFYGIEFTDGRRKEPDGSLSEREFTKAKDRIHYHIIFMDYETDSLGEIDYPEEKKSKLGKFIYEIWPELLEKYLGMKAEPDTIKIEYFGVEKEGKRKGLIDLELRDYFSDPEGKTIPECQKKQMKTRGRKKPKSLKWYEFINRKAIIKSKKPGQPLPHYALPAIPDLAQVEDIAFENCHPECDLPDFATLDVDPAESTQPKIAPPVLTQPDKELDDFDDPDPFGFTEEDFNPPDVAPPNIKMPVYGENRGGLDGFTVADSLPAPESAKHPYFNNSLGLPESYFDWLIDDSPPRSKMPVKPVLSNSKAESENEDLLPF